MTLGILFNDVISNHINLPENPSLHPQTNMPQYFNLSWPRWPYSLRYLHLASFLLFPSFRVQFKYYFSKIFFLTRNLCSFKLSQILWYSKFVLIASNSFWKAILTKPSRLLHSLHVKANYANYIMQNQ